jgi:hypothetical protein
VPWRRQLSRNLRRIDAAAQDHQYNGAAMLQVSWRLPCDHMASHRLICWRGCSQPLCKLALLSYNY